MTNTPATAWRGPRPSPPKWVGWGEDERRSERTLPPWGKEKDAQPVRTKEQGVSRMLTINLNEVEKELKLK